MRKYLLTAGLFLISVSLSAQTNWGLRSGIGVEKKITKGLDAAVEAKYYQTDNFSKTDRWSIGLSLNKRLYRNDAKTFTVKAGLGYRYMNVYKDWSTKYKDDDEGVENKLEPQFYINNKYDFNLKNSYVDTRHRFTASVQAAWELGRLKISVREAYQFTHIDSATYSVDKYRHDDGQTNWTDKNYTKIAGSEYYIRTDESGKSAQDKRQLRSRIGLDYDIPNWKFDPFVSYELFNDIDNGFKTEKSRLTAGVEFSFKKMHNFEVAYMWQNQHDDDEPAGSLVCLSYKFDF
ncbi:MAG: DUF2490 domain-containing protein [Bacteroidaceae bacterium]|nr:DUF2490 domain-containing protein [Bacteroidaceae bacterium]